MAQTNNIGTANMPDSLQFLRSPPTQARSKKALERFIVAGEQVLADNLFEQISISELAALASSSVGTFYRLFTDKEGLFQLLHERFVNETRSFLDETLAEKKWQAKGAADVIHGLVEALVHLYGNKEGLLRALIIRSSSDINFRNNLHGLNSHISNKLTPLLLTRKQQIGHPSPQKAVAFSINIILGTMNHNTLAGIEQMTMPSLCQELTDVILSYLRIEVGIQ